MIKHLTKTQREIVLKMRKVEDGIIAVGHRRQTTLYAGDDVIFLRHSTFVRLLRDGLLEHLNKSIEVGIENYRLTDFGKRIPL